MNRLKTARMIKTLWRKGMDYKQIAGELGIGTRYVKMKIKQFEDDKADNGVLENGRND